MPKKKYINIMTYHGLRGDPSFIENGTRPICASCGNKNMQAVVEVIQHGLMDDKHWLAMRCAKCFNTTIFEYTVPLEGEAAYIGVQE